MSTTQLPVFMSLQDATILIVDDTPINLYILGLILRDAGCKVFEASSGEQALQLLTTQRPEMILLDIMMPGMDGFEVAAQVLTRADCKTIPIIFISALSATEEKVRAFQCGGVDYVLKPFQAEEVLARVNTHLRIIRLQKQIVEEREELRRMNQAFLRARQQAKVVFSALSDHLQGSIFDERYLLDRKIGHGGFGVVYQATHLTLQRQVAVKVFRPGLAHDLNDLEDGMRRFQLEGLSACRVNHPNAVTVIDSGVAEGVPYLVMELLTGHALSSELGQRQPLPVRRCLEIITPVCEVLVAAHAAGVLHRDIKPDNIFLHQTKQGEIIKVLDFGIAKLLGDEPGEQKPTLSGTVGTPIYMAPERMNGRENTGSSDVYSVGIMLYEMLCGSPPFDLESRDYVKILFDHLTKEPPSLRAVAPSVPVELEAIVMAALTKDPLLRPTAQQLLYRLLRVGSLLPVTASPDRSPVVDVPFHPDVDTGPITTTLTASLGGNVDTPRADVEAVVSVHPRANQPTKPTTATGT